MVSLSILCIYSQVGLILTNRLVQLIVILMTGGLLSIGLWGTLSLSQVLEEG